MTQPASPPRMCAHADESTELPNGKFYIQFITEGMPGFNQSRLQFDDLQEARARASIFNHLDRRLTEADVREIQLSSRTAGKVIR